MAKDPTPPDDVLSTENAAALLMLELPVFLDLAKKGWFKAVGPDRWHVVDLVQGNIRRLQDAERFATTVELAEEFGVSVSAIRIMANAGTLPRGEATAVRREIRWDRLACRKAFTKYTQRPRPEGNAPARRISMARAVDLETRTAMLLDELIPVKEVEFVLDTVVDVVSRTFAEARFEGDRQVVKDEVAAALGRISEHRDYAIAALKAGKDPAR